MNKDEKRNVIKSGIFNKSGDKKKLVNYRDLTVVESLMLEILEKFFYKICSWVPFSM